MEDCSELFVLCVRAPVSVSAQPIGRGSADGRLSSEYAARLRDKAFMRGAVCVRSGLSGFRSSRARLCESAVTVTGTETSRTASSSSGRAVAAIWDWTLWRGEKVVWSCNAVLVSRNTSHLSALEVSGRVRPPPKVSLSLPGNEPFWNANPKFSPVQGPGGSPGWADSPRLSARLGRSELSRVHIPC